MKHKPILVAVALAIALLAASGPAAADHGSTHDIELYGTATYVDGTAAANQPIALVVPDGDGTYTTLDSTTTTADGEIANQSTGVGTPLTATVANGTDLRLHLAGDDSTGEFPDGELYRITNQTGTYRVEAVFDTGQSISQYHSATLETDTGSELARWDGSDYVTIEPEPTPEPEPEPEPVEYWNYPNETSEDQLENGTVDEADQSWFDRIFGSSDDPDQPSWFDFDSLWDRLRGAA
jgi:hypothetical protein